MIIDIHAHLWEGSVENNKAAILNAMKKYGIDKVYVSGLSDYIPTPEQVILQNIEVSKFIHEEPRKIGGYVYISPEHDNALYTLQHGIEDQGFDGVKFWISTFCDDNVVNTIIEKVIDYGIPILVHAFSKATGLFPNESEGHNVAKLAHRYPEAKIIMAHLGGNSYLGIPPIADCPNVWVDYSSSIFRGDDLNYAISKLGADRILHGSDLPGSYLVNLGQILEADLSETEKNKILYQNAELIFNRSFKI